MSLASLASWRLRLLWFGLAGGLATAASAAEVIGWDSEWRFLKGRTEASTPDTTAWRKATFDDRAWTAAPAPFWYGDAQPSPGTRVDDMRQSYLCIFLRRTFPVAHPADLSELRLTTACDDGYIAWINGREVQRFNVPAGPPTIATQAVGAAPEPVQPETFTLADPASYLVSGDNVLAIQVFNVNYTSSDLVFNASLETVVDDTVPVVMDLLPPAGATVRALTQIEVGFNKPVAGVDAADLLIAEQAATRLTQVDAARFVFEFPEPPTGQVAVAWSPAHGIRDLASTPHPFRGGEWTYRLNPNAPVPAVMISEFLADNDDSMRDEDGDASDWIELFNPTPDPADLTGWFLTDTLAEPTRWRFPGVVLPPRAYLLVFASGKNRSNPAARLHTNFKLERSGGSLALLDSRTNVVSAFAPAYPAQYEDISYGRDRSAAEVVGYFPQPTPGAPNASGGPGFAPRVGFIPAGGTFITPFDLRLAAPATNATLYYTLDGTMPTNTSRVYTEPIRISGTVQVRARAFVPGRLPGPPRSEVYFALAPSVVNSTSDLPLVVIHTLGNPNIPANGDAYAQLAVFEPKHGVSSLTNVPDLNTRAGLNIRGSSTFTTSGKSSFSVECWDEFNDDRDLELLGLPADSDWVLYAPNNFEPVLIHNSFAHELSRRIGRYSPRTRFVELYLNKTGGAIGSGHYWGIYLLEEKIKRGPARVDVDALAPEHAQPPQVTGGYLMKIDRLDPGDNGVYAGGAGFGMVYPKEVELETPQRRPQLEYLRGYLDDFYAALTGPNFRDPQTGYAAYIDAGAWIDHHLLNIVTFNVDALRLSAYFYKERNGKLGFGPLWDFDRALGSTDGRDANPRVWRATSGDRGTDFFRYDTQPWWGRLFEDIDFWQRWIDRWQTLRGAEVALTNLHAIVDAQTGELRRAQPREQTRWGNTPRGGSYQGEIDLLKRWLSNRVDFIDTNFLARPRLATPAGPVAPGFVCRLEGPPKATVYYTLDGTDPRLPGGAVSPKALVYTQPVPIAANARVVARAHNPAHRNLTGGNNPPLSSPWSGPATATYVVAMPPLVVTELMYHPAAPPPGSAFDTEDFEYVELRNVGTETLRLAGFRFTAGLQFTFPEAGGVPTLAPGAYVAIVKNLAAFRTRYPGVTPVAGEYVGNLDNAGERLALVGSLDEPILDFSYDPGVHPVTDGAGFALVIRDDHAPPATWNDPAAWQTGTDWLGTPGRPESPRPSFPAVLVNEVLTHTDPPATDAVELFNPGPAAADLSGWFLSDDFGEPLKYRFPPGTVVPVAGFLVLTEEDFNVGPAGFSFSAQGDEVYLFSGDDTGPTGYVHGFRFGPAARGVSFGRQVTSTGDEAFVPQARPTLGAPNAGPRTGPVVLNEIHFHPSPVSGLRDTANEFIELWNLGSEPAALFDPLCPDNTWRIRGGADLDLPTGLTLSPGGFALVVNFDPVERPEVLRAFRERFKVSPDTPVFGPIEGNLDNAGERVALERPDEAPGGAAGIPVQVPWLLVEEVAYRTAAPWTTEANGTGRSLQRLAGQAYANDPVNWVAADPSPGRPNPVANVDADADSLPDAWEVAAGLDPRVGSGDHGPDGDPDHDGLTNRAEWQAGTAPRDPTSRLALEAGREADGSLALGFTTAPGRTYSVLACEDLGTGTWRTLTDVAAQPESRRVLVPDAIASRARFYRLVTPSR